MKKYIKVIILMFGFALITGCSENEETIKSTNIKEITVADGDCGEETGQPCQTANCFRCNLKLGNNLTPINADTPYSTPNNTKIIKKLTVKKTNKVKKGYINSRYEKISKEAKKKATKATNTRKRRLEAMSKIVREIQPSESK